MHCGKATNATVSPARRSFCNTRGRSVLKVPLARAVFLHFLEEVLVVELGVFRRVGDVPFVFFQDSASGCTSMSMWRVPINLARRRELREEGLGRDRAFLWS